jgi:hypothetical protein
MSHVRPHASNQVDYNEKGARHHELQAEDVFGAEEGHQIQYKTLSWQVSGVIHNSF